MILDPFLPSISTATVFLEPEDLLMFTKVTAYIVILSLSNVITYFYIVMHNTGRHWKSIIIYDVTEANLQQKQLFRWTKMYFWTSKKVNLIKIYV